MSEQLRDVALFVGNNAVLGSLKRVFTGDVQSHSYPLSFGTTPRRVTTPIDFVTPSQTQRRRRAHHQQPSQQRRGVVYASSVTEENSDVRVGGDEREKEGEAKLNVQNSKDFENAEEEKEVIQRYYQTYKWRGYDINYFEEGNRNGKPVLFVHGFGASINHWRKNISALLARGAGAENNGEVPGEESDGVCEYRVFAIDLLGLGGSSKASPSEVDYSIELWTEQIKEFIEARFERGFGWNLVGNSIGSLICLNATKTLADEGKRDHVRSLSLMNCAGGLVSFRYEELGYFQRMVFFAFNRLLFNRFVGRFLFESIRQPEQLGKVLQQVYIDRSAITPELLTILSEPAYDAGALDVFLAILNGPAGPKPEELLRQVEWCPTLVVWGEKDPWTPLNEGFHPGKEFPKYHEGLVLKTIPDAGHCIHDEVAPVVNEVLIPFLATPTFRGQE